MNKILNSHLQNFNLYSYLIWSTITAIVTYLFIYVKIRQLNREVIKIYKEYELKIETYFNENFYPNEQV